MNAAAIQERTAVPPPPRRGLTLIELMVVVAIVAVLAAVALPSYQEHVRKSKRAEAQAFMLAVAARQAQFLVDTRAFAATLVTAGVPTPANVDAAYTATLVVAAAVPPTFTLTLAPKPAQAAEKCGSLTINHASVKTAAVAGCW